MSDNIPFEIQAEIIKRVSAVKSLMRFRSVSKQWKSLIDSSQFITHHTLNHQAQPNHLLITYTDDCTDRYVSVADDDSFPQHKFSRIVTRTVRLLTQISMLDCSHGLVCLSGICTRTKAPVRGKHLIVVWNPSIKKSVGIEIPYGIRMVGFGVCPRTCDPKIVTMARANGQSESGWKAEVYALSSGTWRPISMNLCWSHRSIRFSYHYHSSNQVVIDGAIRWIAFDSVTESHLRIVSFDLTSEEFGEVDLPDGLAHPTNLYISKIKKSLAVINYNEATLVSDVWVMTQNGDPKSCFTKLFTISFKRTVDTISRKIIGFRKNGQLITEHGCRSRRPDRVMATTLEVYESSSEHCNDLRIDVVSDSFFMTTSYTESLLLLNHSDTIIQL